MKCASKLTERENCVTNTDNKYCLLWMQVNLKEDVSPWCSVRAALYTVGVSTKLDMNTTFCKHSITDQIK